MTQDRKRRAKTEAGAKQQAKGQKCCGATASAGTCCKVEALINVDERGQMVLPKELRDRANVRAGDKFAVTSLEKDGRICCIVLTKAEDLSGMVITVLGPVVRNMT